MNISIIAASPAAFSRSYLLPRSFARSITVSIITALIVDTDPPVSTRYPYIMVKVAAMLNFMREKNLFRSL